MSAIRPALRSALRPAIRSVFGGSAAVWTPLTLFANSEVGVWYDPSDLTTLWQDTAGTVPVTADGQAVARIDDKSGNGKHATQADAAKRPLYKTSGGLSWLQFDGTDDFLVTSAIDFSATDKVTVFFGEKTTDALGFDGLFQFGNFAASGSIWAYRTANNLEFKARGSSNTSAIIAAAASGSKAVTTASVNFGGATGATCLAVRMNGGALASATVVAGAANGQNATMTFGLAVGVYLKGNIYPLIIRGAASSTDEIDSTEAWVNSKTGAY